MKNAVRLIAGFAVVVSGSGVELARAAGSPELHNIDGNTIKTAKISAPAVRVTAVPSQPTPEEVVAAAAKANKDLRDMVNGLDLVLASNSLQWLMRGNAELYYDRAAKLEKSLQKVRVLQRRLKAGEKSYEIIMPLWDVNKEVQGIFNDGNPSNDPKQDSLFQMEDMLRAQFGSDASNAYTFPPYSNLRLFNFCLDVQSHNLGRAQYEVLKELYRLEESIMDADQRKEEEDIGQDGLDIVFYTRDLSELHDRLRAQTDRELQGILNQAAPVAFRTRIKQISKRRAYDLPETN